MLVRVPYLPLAHSAFALALFLAIAIDTPYDSLAAELPRDMTDQLAASASDEEIVDHLLQVRKEAGVSRALAIHYPKLDRNKACRIQMALLKRLEASGERLAGWKMGGTKIVNPGDKLDPAFGFMLESDRRSPGTVLQAANFAANEPIIESEIGFWIGEDLPDGKVSREQLEATIAGVGGACELISARMRPAADGLVLPIDIAIADGLSHGGFLLPRSQVRLAQLDVSSEKGRVAINGKVVAQGKASVLMEGDPLAAVLALANQLPQHGRRLRAGQVVVIGSMLDSPAAHAGDDVDLDFSSLESIRMQFK